MANGEAFNDWVGLTFGRGAAAMVKGIRLALTVEALLGILPMLAGALLLALALGRPAPVTPATVAHPKTARSGWLWWGWMLCGGVLLALEAWRLSQRAAGTQVILLWLGGIAAGWTASVALDRMRGTSFGNPFPQRGEWAVVAAVVGLVLLLAGHDAGTWRWSGIPDEAFFYQAAVAILDGKSGESLLSERGVFDYHPVLSSGYQAAFLFVFGRNAFAWKFSSVAAFALALPFVYLLARELRGRRAAWMATALFASAPLAVGFAHLGYNNAQVYAPVAASLALFAYSDRRRSAVGYFLAGCALGLCFFTFFTARLALLLLPLLAWSRVAPARLWRDRRAAIFLVFGFVATALPILIHLDESLVRMFEAAGLGRDPVVSAVQPGSPQFGSALGARARRALAHWLVASFYGVFSQNSHMQTRPVLDPFSVSLSTTGVLLGIAGLLVGRRDFLAPAYLLSTFWVGCLSSYGEPPLTRLMFLAPLSAVLAATTLDHALKRCQSRLGIRVASGAGALIVAIAVVWNVVLLQSSVRHRYHGYAEGTGTELIRASRGFPAETNLAIALPPSSSSRDGLREVVEPYGIARRLTIVISSQPEMPPDLQLPLVVFHGLPNSDETRAFEQGLQDRYAPSDWSDTDLGRRWNLRFLFVPGEAPGDGNTGLDFLRRQRR